MLENGILQIGGAHTASSSHAAGASDTLTLKGDWGPGEHRVEIFPVSGMTATPVVSQAVTVRSEVETVLTFDLGGGQETQVRERPAPPG